jgi:hypothetical protein
VTFDLKAYYDDDHHKCQANDCPQIITNVNVDYVFDCATVTVLEITSYDFENFSTTQLVPKGSETATAWTFSPPLCGPLSDYTFTFGSNVPLGVNLLNSA